MALSRLFLSCPFSHRIFPEHPAKLAFLWAPAPRDPRWGWGWGIPPTLLRSGVSGGREPPEGQFTRVLGRPSVGKGTHEKEKVPDTNFMIQPEDTACDTASGECVASGASRGPLPRSRLLLSRVEAIFKLRSCAAWQGFFKRCAHSAVT